MAAPIALYNLLPTPISAYTSLKCLKIKPHGLAPARSQFLSSTSTSRLKSRSLIPGTGISWPRISRCRCRRWSIVFAAQSDFLRVLQTVWNVGKDGIEAGTNLVPDSIPRPIARISVTVVTLTLSIFVLKSFLSTAFFVLGTMGLVYFIYLAFNKDNGPRGGGGGSSSSSNTSVDESLEEARRIMEKYK
ncbi:hypothetical protein SAY86_011995 [Trapa natans]|uniref:Uncharacterized protein n=1 Tax=Trapa natans TaxID=22666 RepID=A0AAN7MC17_TRANT|nr:hypothetical protein SAY86_011995 [Trapa natans]